VPGPAAGPAGDNASARGALTDASQSDSTDPFWYATCKGHDKEIGKWIIIGNYE
jgi:hypothetical protein